MEDYKQELHAMKKRLLQRRVSFFAWNNYEYYLSQGINKLLQAYPCDGVESDEKTDLASLEKVVSTYRAHSFFKRLWLRLTSSIGVYLRLYELKVVMELSDCLENEPDLLTAYEHARVLYNTHQTIVKPTLFEEIINHWHWQLFKLSRKLESAEQTLFFEKKHKELEPPAKEDILRNLESQLNQAEGCHLPTVVNCYAKLRAFYPAYDQKALAQLERRILLKLHPDKNLHQLALAEDEFKRFGMIKNRENNSLRPADASLVRQRELFKERSETWYAKQNKWYAEQDKWYAEQKKWNAKQKKWNAKQSKWLAEQEKEIKEMKAILSSLLKRGFFVLPAEDTEIESLPEKSLSTPGSE